MSTTQSNPPVSAGQLDALLDGLGDCPPRVLSLDSLQLTTWASYSDAAVAAMELLGSIEPGQSDQTQSLDDSELTLIAERLDNDSWALSFTRFSAIDNAVYASATERFDDIGVAGHVVAQILNLPISAAKGGSR